MRPGTRVRMSELLKEALASSSLDHLAEFGECIGIVQGPTDYNNCPPSDPAYDKNKVGPEVDVRWQPKNLRYAYLPRDLENVDDTLEKAMAFFMAHHRHRWIVVRKSDGQYLQGWLRENEEVKTSWGTSPVAVGHTREGTVAALKDIGLLPEYASERGNIWNDDYDIKEITILMMDGRIVAYLPP